MADHTHIEWTDATWNVVTGCSVVSPGCTNCYAMKLAGTRLRDHPSRAGLTVASKAGPVWNGQVRFNADWLQQPLRWKKPRRIFVAAHGDLFHDGVTDDQLDQIFAVMALCPQHTFQVLTKRPERMQAYVADPAARLRAMDAVNEVLPLPLYNGNGQKQRHLADRDRIRDRRCEGQEALAGCYLPNVWLGVSVEDQTRAVKRIPRLLQTPAAVRWISAEPLLGPIDLTTLCDGYSFWSATHGLRYHDAPDDMPCVNEVHPKLDWVVVGGESGQGARPMHPKWAQYLRDQCAETGVAFLFKQWGNWGPVCELDADALDDRLYHATPARNPEATRRCKVPSTVLHWDAERFDRPADARAYQAGKEGMLMFDVGKSTTGRLLDGVLHDAYPARD